MEKVPDTSQLTESAGDDEPTQGIDKKLQTLNRETRKPGLRKYTPAL